MIKLHKFNNGLKVLTYNNKFVKSITCGIMVGSGSIDEKIDNNGIAHVTEHMLFKGTKDKSPFEIADGFEKLGINVNAFTTKECTCFYLKSIDEYFEQGFCLLCDIFCNSIFKNVELAKEKKVICEEINMTKDSAEDLCYDLLAEIQFQNHPLGRPIIGNSENVLSFTKKDIDDFINKHYTSSNIVVSFSGNITPENANDLVEKYLAKNLSNKEAQKPKESIPPYKRGYLHLFKDFEQANLAILYPSINFDNESYVAQSIANIALGGGMSSRLFQVLREEKGLAYSIYSIPSYYKDSGSFNIVANINPKNTTQAYDLILKELNKLKENGLTQQEFERAKTQMKAAFIFGQDSMQTIMLSAAKKMIFSNKIYNSDEIIEKIKQTTIDDTNDFIKKIFCNDEFSVAYVGKEVDFFPIN